MPKFKSLFKFGVVLAVIGIILVTLGYFMPYKNTRQINIPYGYGISGLGIGGFLYQGEWYNSADCYVPAYEYGPSFWSSEGGFPFYLSFEDGKQYRITLINYETPDHWRGNASDSKIFFWKLPLNETSTPEKVIPLMKSSTYEFILDRDTTLYIKLATNLSEDQMKEQGYYPGIWMLSLTIEWPGQGNYGFVLIGIIFLVTGFIVIARALPHKKILDNILVNHLYLKGVVRLLTLIGKAFVILFLINVLILFLVHVKLITGWLGRSLPLVLIVEGMIVLMIGAYMFAGIREYRYYWYEWWYLTTGRSQAGVEEFWKHRYRREEWGFALIIVGLLTSVLGLWLTTWVPIWRFGEPFT